MRDCLYNLLTFELTPPPNWIKSWAAALVLGRLTPTGSGREVAPVGDAECCHAQRSSCRIDRGLRRCRLPYWVSIDRNITELKGITADLAFTKCLNIPVNPRNCSCCCTTTRQWMLLHCHRAFWETGGFFFFLHVPQSENSEQLVGPDYMRDVVVMSQQDTNPWNKLFKLQSSREKRCSHFSVNKDDDNSAQSWALTPAFNARYIYSLATSMLNSRWGYIHFTLLQLAACHTVSNVFIPLSKGHATSFTSLFHFQQLIGKVFKLIFLIFKE